MKSWFSGRSQPAAVRRSVSYSTSPLLASKTPPWRSKFVVALVGLGSLVLVGRAVMIQIVDNRFYLDQGEKRYAHELDLPAFRGRITDRHGALLATSIPVPSVWAIPKEVQATREQKRELARLLNLPPTEVDKKLGNPNDRFEWLARQVDEPVWQRIKALKIKGIYEAREYRRQYPEGEAAAHLIGFTNTDERGQEGVERAFERELQGKEGSRTVVKDRLGRVVEDLGERVQPNNGRDVQLSIDAKVQSYAYQRVRDAVLEHKAEAGTAVVVDTRTGELLAIANYPSFNPGQRKNLKGDQAQNRALSNSFEPGSTIKPLVAALALDTGRVSSSTVLNTAPGSLTVSGKPIRDDHPHPSLTVAEVVQKSNNIGTVRMAMQMDRAEMWALFSQVGFGRRPALTLPSMTSGRLRPAASWKPIEQATMSYGYGLSVSPVQLAQAYTVFARDGELIPVTLERQAGPAQGVRVFKPETARAVRSMLRDVATADGTARKAQAIGYSVGGKTGTAYKHIQGTGEYDTRKYYAWFVGMAPIDDPRIVVAVLIDQPSAGGHFGGDVAAPVFSQVVQHTLRLMNVEPDLQVKPQIMAGTANAAVVVAGAN